jgi:hypothetical protein
MDEWTNTYVCNIYIERVCVKERKQKYGWMEKDLKQEGFCITTQPRTSLRPIVTEEPEQFPLCRDQLVPDAAHSYLFCIETGLRRGGKV